MIDLDNLTPLYPNPLTGEMKPAPEHDDEPRNPLPDHFHRLPIKSPQIARIHVIPIPPNYLPDKELHGIFFCDVRGITL